jgi:hypothetical protein
MEHEHFQGVILRAIRAGALCKTAQPDHGRDERRQGLPKWPFAGTRDPAAAATAGQARKRR